MFFKTAFLWNAALSRIIVEPAFNSFNRHFSNQSSNCCSGVFHWSNPLSLAYSGSNISASEFSAANFRNYLLSARRSCIFTIKTLVNGYKDFWRYTYQLLHILLSRAFIHFPVKSNFLRDIFNRTNAFGMAASESPNTCAISFKYASECSCHILLALPGQFYTSFFAWFSL